MNLFEEEDDFDWDEEEDDFDWRKKRKQQMMPLHFYQMMIKMEVIF